MRICHCLTTAMLLSLGWAAPAQAVAKPRPASAQKLLQAQKALQAQVDQLTAERDDLKSRLAATESLQEDLAATQKSRDMARQETESIQKQLDQMKTTLAENQGSSDTILSELQKAKADLAASLAANEALRSSVAAVKDKQSAPVAEGALVTITPDIIPAIPMNLSRITPKAKKVGRGVVVVNVLVNESGEVLDTRLLQGLPGQGEWVDKANAACVDAAKRIVFDPARGADGKTKLRVWQGVGFMID
jgi:vacuolar-type H+-ATPase subunit I/STV1